MKNIEKIFSKEFILQRIDVLKADKRAEIFELPPYRVEIQPTSYCNRKCSFCSHEIRNKTATEISYHTFSKLLESLRMCGCKNLSFSGGGEPFLWKRGKLLEAVRAAARFADVTLTTNGDGFMDLDDNVNKEFLNLCSAIILNTPATNEELYRSMVMGNINWDTNCNIIKQLIRLRNKIKSTCRIYCVVVVNRNNIKDLINIDKDLIELNVDEIYYKQVKNYEGGRLDYILVDQESLNYCREKLDSDNSIWLSQFLDYHKENEFNHEKMTCCWANIIGMNAIVNPSGDVFICTPTVGIEEYCIGNINENDFQTIWYGNNRKRVIDKLNAKYKSDGCSDTCRYLGHNHAIENYIMGIEQKLNVNAGADNTIQ